MLLAGTSYLRQHQSSVALPISQFSHICHIACLKRYCVINVPRVVENDPRAVGRLSNDVSKPGTIPHIGEAICISGHLLRILDKVTKPPITRK